MALRTLHRAGLAAALVTTLVSAAPRRADAAPNLGRVWLYGNATAMVSPSWSLTIMPGIRFELARDQQDAEAFGHYMDELFVGPNYHRRFGPLSLSVSLWYYFAGFDILERYTPTHSLELVPVLRLQLGRVALTSRTIFHNILYSGVNEGPESAKRGYALVLRQLLQVGVRLNKRVTLLAASEPFFGVIEDANAEPSLLGFWARGFRMHRLYGGVALRLADGITLVPQWIYETLLDDDGGVAHHGHYLFVTIAYRFRLFG